MKNLKYIAVFILILSSSLSFKVTAQNSLIQTPVLNSGPYAGGTIITIDYSMEYTMLTGNKAELNITFPPKLAFVSSSLTSNGIWGIPTILAGNVKYQTTPFTPGDNNYTSATDFTVNFRVISTDCNLSNDIVSTTLSTLTGSIYSNPVPATTPISIQNNGAGISTTMNLLQGDECSVAMYEINSFGLDTNSSNSTFALTVPAGATLQGVFNTIGNNIAFAPSGPGPTTYSWSRSGISSEKSQTHYAIIAYDQSILCQSSSNLLGLIFNSHNVCNPSDSISTTMSYNIPACCNQPPNTMNGVVLHKSLIKYPLRYFPSPDNCKTHDYIIKVDNLTPNNLNNFVLSDFLDGIVSSFSGEIEVTQITATFNQIFPSSPSSFQFSSSLGSYLPPPIITLSNSTPSKTLYPNINTISPSLPFLDSDFSIIGSTVFPKYSTLTVKITHRLGVPLSSPNTPYNNKAQLDFKVGGIPYSGNVTLQSFKDVFEPAITLEKKVSVNGGAFSANVSANPGDALNFQIRIRNYGMMAVSGANLIDLISEIPSFSNFTTPTLFSVTGIGYTALQLSTIQSGSISPTGFARNFPINVAPCNGYTELVITYQTNVKHNVTCNSIYTNTATLNYNFNGNHTISSFATVNIDLFKNITFKLEANCKGPEVNAPWTTGNINGIPGQPIWYKASLRNGNNYAVSGLKMMVQLPSAPYLSTSHGSISLVSSTPLTPTGTNLQPLLVSGAGSITGSALNNWLNTPAALPLIPVGNIALYKIIPLLNPNAETTIIYKVIVPVNYFGTQYKTAMGVSGFSSSSCPIVKQTADTLTVASSNACGSISGCDLIMFDSKIERDLSNLMNFKVTLSNMLNNYSGFNINNFDIVVHQPYTAIVTTSPYSRSMIGYKLDAISSGYTPFTFPLGTPIVDGRRYHRVNNVPPLNFGDVNFDIISTNLPPVSTNLTFPINLTFRDEKDPCTICERNIYLNYKLVVAPWNQLIQNDMLKSEKDPVNISLNQARQHLQKSPAGAKIEQWYKDLKEHDGISKMILNHPKDVIKLFSVARKMIEKGSVFEQEDYDLIEKNMRILDGVWKAPAGLIDNSLRQLKSTIGQKWSLDIFDRWGNH